MISLLSLTLVTVLGATPATLTTSLFDHAASIHSPDEGVALTKGQTTTNQKAFKKLDTLIDLNAFASSIMKPHTKHFTRKQLKQLTSDFAQTVRLIGFPRAGTFRDKATIEIADTLKAKDRTSVTVFAEIPSEELEVELVFHWSNQTPTRVFDISIDGSSLIKDYQNQFGRIIKKSGAQALLTKINNRLQSLRQKYGT